MDNDTNKRILPSLIGEALNHPGRCVDNVFAGVWKGLKLNRLIQQAGFKKHNRPVYHGSAVFAGAVEADEVD
ncbi:MAG TPA: hypothetical protein ENI94_02550 [Gammaproteobacteria bacterium]|nr:hypothetical protein [Gammaproteobacteria bacterium]